MHHLLHNLLLLLQRTPTSPTSPTGTTARWRLQLLFLLKQEARSLAMRADLRIACAPKRVCCDLSRRVRSHRARNFNTVRSRGARHD